MRPANDEGRGEDSLSRRRFLKRATMTGAAALGAPAARRSFNGEWERNTRRPSNAATGVFLKNQSTPLRETPAA